MAKKKAIIISIFAGLILVGGLGGWLLLTNQSPSVTQTPSGDQVSSTSATVTGETVERPAVYQQEIRVTIGDSIILGKITNELADLGTIKVGDKASYKIVIRNGEDEPIGIIANTSGNISAVIAFDYTEIIEPQSSGVITVNISGDEKGFYSGTIKVERQNED